MSHLVFLPGASGHGSFWDPIRQHLGHFTTTSFDWPGLGGVPADPSIGSYDDLVRLVADTIERDSDQRCVLIGQSMGGWVAARLAISRPDLVDKVVLAATSAGLDMTSLGAVDWRPGARANRPESPEWSFAEHPVIEDGLAALEAPALLLWASNDSISPIAVGHRLDELIPSSELVVYDSDDHWVVRHHGADVAARIAEFVAG